MTALLIVAFAASPLPTAANALPWDSLHLTRGEWAEYVFTTGDVPTGPYLRLSVVAATGEGGALELWISQRPGSASQVFRLEISKEGQVFRLRRLHVRFGDGKLVELPIPAHEAGRVLNAPTPGCQGCRRERVRVPAGSFDVERRPLGPGGTAWTAPGVGPLQLVRLSLASGLGLSLIASGYDARSALGDAP